MLEHVLTTKSVELSMCSVNQIWRPLNIVSQQVHCPCGVYCWRQRHSMFWLVSFVRFSCL